MADVTALLTFEDLVECAEARHQNAREPVKIAAWKHVLDVLQRLVGGREDEGLVAGRAWSLTRVTVDGFQGVTTMQPLVLDPSPGVTVLFGSNGAGKSSIADAIEAALQGTAPLVAAGGGGSAPLWERRHCARDAATATVEVTLSDGPQHLVLTVALGADGTVQGRTARLRVGDEVRDVDLAATPWASALATGRPVFGYAAVERRVQRARDLRDFLAPLLGLGGCLDAVKEALDEAGRAAIDADGRFERARQEAQQAVAEVDRRIAVDGEPHPPQPAWPAIDDDPDAWCLASDLVETGAAVEPVTDDDLARLSNAAAAVEPALRALEGAEHSVIARLAGPLRDLHRHAEELPEPGTTCPVCGTAETSWTTTLGESLDGLDALDEHERTFRSRLATLHGRLDTEFSRVVTVLDQEWLDRTVAAAAAPTREFARTLQEAIGRHGTHSDPEIRDAVRALATAFTSDAWADAARETVRQSDRRRQWLRARRDAVGEFLAVWRIDGPVGAAAASWHEAQGHCLRTLQNEVWKQRTSDLRGAVDNAVRRLLHDVGLHVDDMSIQGTKADIRVRDSANRPVELATLSAGQRNALLLAPLLSSHREGPFRFLVLDDPVHSFDQIRVDRLARLIVELAERRRVVVLTHDERLREHLLSSAPTSSAHDVARAVETGTVTHAESTPVWRGLLDDARAVLGLAADRQQHGTTTPPTDLARRFFRMAVDAALRQFVLARSFAAARDVHADLAALDAKKTTDGRFEKARALHPGVTIDEAISAFAPYRVTWNMAVHGNSNAPAFDPAETSAAERMCTLLAGDST